MKLEGPMFGYYTMYLIYLGVWPIGICTHVPRFVQASRYVPGIVETNTYNTAKQRHSATFPCITRYNRSFEIVTGAPVGASNTQTSKPPVESDGGSAFVPFPHDTSMSSVSVSSTVAPRWKTSHSRKQFDFAGCPSIVTFCIGCQLHVLGSYLSEGGLPARKRSLRCHLQDFRQSSL